MFLRLIDGHYYWYQSIRKEGKVVSQYLSKATEREVDRWRKTK